MGFELDLVLLVVGWRGLEGGVKERVHQSALAQARFADAKHVEGESGLHRFVDQLVGERVEADMAAEVQAPWSRGAVGHASTTAVATAVQGGGGLNKKKKKNIPRWWSASSSLGLNEHKCGDLFYSILFYSFLFY